MQMMRVHGRSLVIAAAVLLVTLAALSAQSRPAAPSGIGEVGRFQIVHVERNSVEAQSTFLLDTVSGKACFFEIDRGTMDAGEVAVGNTGLKMAPFYEGHLPCWGL
jgi:hypothetical protein